ncbi:unnamed protein product [Adineta ricciae]|uniref:Apple domain-containing protein n=1 Tax=Adineta ricciae TaxID=249248 RepID=A0A815SWH4_ADIRI|nr:unnamed protein product [Adineta ricciae]CAF1603508.1 unnamed protein product [Adineta ricciae]
MFEIILILFLLIQQSAAQDMRSFSIYIIANSQFQCVNTTCSPFNISTTESALKCRMKCLHQIQCQAASFQQSLSTCQLFANILDQYTSTFAQLNTIAMIVKPGTRIPSEPTTTSSSTTTTTSSSSTTSTTTTTSSSSSSSTTTTTTTTSTTTLLGCESVGNTLVTFDDLASGTVIPNSYNNINWNNAYAFINSYAVSGYPTGTVSQNCTSLNGGGTSMTMTCVGSTLFTLYSAAFTAAWNDNLQLNVVGYRSGSIIANSTYILQVFSLSNIAFTGFSNLDTAIFSTSGGTLNPTVSSSGLHYSMDNLCISVV